MLTGSVSQRQSQVLTKALNQINNNPNALWRYGNEKDQISSEDGNGKSKDTSSFVKDVYVDLIEYADCIINE